MLFQNRKLYPSLLFNNEKFDILLINNNINKPTVSLIFIGLLGLTYVLFTSVKYTFNPILQVFKLEFINMYNSLEIYNNLFINI